MNVALGQQQCEVLEVFATVLTLEQRQLIALSIMAFCVHLYWTGFT